MRTIKSVDDLTALYPDAVPASITKVARRLTSLYWDWIEGSRFCILSTVGPDGVHGSPRGDDGSVVRVEGERTLLLPDWRGNNRLDCLRDIVEDGRVALLFMVPGSNFNGHMSGMVSRSLLMPVPPAFQTFNSTSSPTSNPPVPGGPSSDLWPVKANKAPGISDTSISTVPADWDTSTMSRISEIRHIS